MPPWKRPMLLALQLQSPPSVSWISHGGVPPFDSKTIQRKTVFYIFARFVGGRVRQPDQYAPGFGLRGTDRTFNSKIVES